MSTRTHPSGGQQPHILLVQPIRIGRHVAGVPVDEQLRVAVRHRVPDARRLVANVPGALRLVGGRAGAKREAVRKSVRTSRCCRNWARRRRRRDSREQQQTNYYERRQHCACCRLRAQSNTASENGRTQHRRVVVRSSAYSRNDVESKFIWLTDNTNT